MLDNNDDESQPPTIAFTRKRTTTKTRTAATSARRRKNIPLCHAAAAGSGHSDDTGKDQHSWFARKSAGWTNEEIKSHLTSGGVSQGGKSFSMVGDVILGDGPSSLNSKKDKKRKKLTTFVWEEKEETDADVGNRGMAAAPLTLQDIMDDQDEVDIMSPLKVGKSYQMKDSILKNDGNNNYADTKSNLRRKNAALDELAQVSGIDHGAGGSRTQPTSANESIGWRLLRVLGYIERLGLAFVPLAGHVGGSDSLDSEVKELEHEQGESPTHEAKWLASKRLRAIRLPSIQNVDSKDSSDTTKGHSTDKNKMLTIPPPKTNRHGIGFDPFKNAPEFRAFHEQRRALAQTRGKSDVEGGQRRDRYFTNNLRKDGRQALWDKGHGNTDNNSENDDMSDPGRIDKSQQHSHYAADRDYTDFIGTQASSGFALHDEDDANVYQDGEGHGSNDRKGDYTTEIHSPIASSDEEDNGLFENSTLSSVSKKKAPEKRMNNQSQDQGKVEDAWSTWGIGSGSAVQQTTTMGGQPPMPGFTLGHSKFNSNNQKVDAPKRWNGPVVPSRYVLKRHVFTVEEDNGIKTSTINGMDSGLGSVLQPQQQQQPSKSFVPQVLTSKPLPSPGKMLAKDGTELKFHAVKESMRSRFVTSAGTTNTERDSANNKDEDKQDMNKEEWVQVTSTLWVPTRLLCKRWGVTMPSTVGDIVAGSLGGKVQCKEESYFRQTIMADYPNEAPTESAKSTNNKGTKLDMQLDASLEGEDLGPTLDRPSQKLYQDIFNAESDMEISSDDDESASEELNSAQSSTPKQVKEVKGKGTAPLSDPDRMKNDNTKAQPTVAPPIDYGDSDSSGSTSSNERRKEKRKKSDRRKKISSQRDNSPIDSDGESIDSSANHRKRRRKKKHKKHHSRRHKKSRH